MGKNFPSNKSKRSGVTPVEQRVLVAFRVHLAESDADLEQCSERVAEHHYLHPANVVGEHLR